MKKVLSSLIAAVCVTACAFSFTACGDDNGNDETHTQHNWSATYTQDGDRHYQTCDGCNEKNYSRHSYVDGVCICGKQKGEQGGEETPPEVPAELKAMSTCFNGVKVIENKTALNSGTENKSFEQILDRQFSVLAEDILYRLYLVYGENTYGTESDFQNIDLNFTYNGNSAKVIKNTALTNLSFHDSNIIVHEYENIDCIFCYQSFIKHGVGDNRLSNREYIRQDGAIVGKFFNFDGRQLSDAVNSDKIWLYNDYSKWNTDYRAAFKYELAKIVYGDENTNLTYNELLAKINTTGFAADAEQKITDTIYSKVIGENLVAENLRIYNMFSESDKSNIKNWTNESEIEKHYFKGYNITVPAIVKQALANTFDNSNVSLYPAVSRQSVNVSNSFDNITVSDKTQSIVLMPKANTPVTKLAFEVSGTAGQSVTLNFNILANGVKKTVTKTVVLTAEKQTVEIDLSAAGVSALGAYNGNTNSYTSNALFNNPDGTDTNGDNYISVDFENNSAQLTIKFTGLYNK